jgi:hypothetical protein
VARCTFSESREAITGPTSSGTPARPSAVFSAILLFTAEEAVKVGRCSDDISSLERALSAARGRSVITRSDCREHMAHEHKQSKEAAANGE